jgi:hypothetical protein
MSFWNPFSRIDLLGSDIAPNRWSSSRTAPHSAASEAIWKTPLSFACRTSVVALV